MYGGQYENENKCRRREEKATLHWIKHKRSEREKERFGVEKVWPILKIIRRKNNLLYFLRVCNKLWSSLVFLKLHVATAAHHSPICNILFVATRSLSPLPSWIVQRLVFVWASRSMHTYEWTRCGVGLCLLYGQADNTNNASLCRCICWSADNAVCFTAPYSLPPLSLYYSANVCVCMCVFTALATAQLNCCCYCLFYNPRDRQNVSIFEVVQMCKYLTVKYLFGNRSYRRQPAHSGTQYEIGSKELEELEIEQNEHELLRTISVIRRSFIQSIAVVRHSPIGIAHFIGMMIWLPMKNHQRCTHP